MKIKVNGGGCTGLTYGMSAEAEPSENDEIFEFHGVKVLVDKYDIPVLEGTKDFKQSLMGGGFQIDNQTQLHLVVGKFIQNCKSFWFTRRLLKILNRVFMDYSSTKCG